MAISVCPDTSPRGVDIEGDSESWDFGKGAGFYVNATEAKWANNYKMYDYVTKELPAIVNSTFKTNGWLSVLYDKQIVWEGVSPHVCVCVNERARGRVARACVYVCVLSFCCMLPLSLSQPHTCSPQVRTHVSLSLCTHLMWAQLRHFITLLFFVARACFAPRACAQESRLSWATRWAVTAR